MWRKNTVLLLLLTLTSALLVPNCATLTRKSTQKIPVTSSPTGATVSVNGVQQGVTPLEVKMARKKKGQVIRIESPGYNPMEIRMKHKFSGIPHLLSDVLLGAFIGLWLTMAVGSGGYDAWIEGFKYRWPWVPAAIGSLLLVDLAPGKGYTLTPKELIVTLKKADGAPRVDTMFVDADEFRNIKWIRVRRD